MAFKITRTQERVVLRKSPRFLKKEEKRVSAKKKMLLVGGRRKWSQWSWEEHMLMWKAWSETDVCLCFGTRRPSSLEGQPVDCDCLKLWRHLKEPSCWCGVIQVPDSPDWCVDTKFTLMTSFHCCNSLKKTTSFDSFSVFSSLFNELQKLKIKIYNLIQKIWVHL